MSRNQRTRRLNRCPVDLDRLSVWGGDEQDDIVYAGNDCCSLVWLVSDGLLLRAQNVCEDHHHPLTTESRIREIDEPQT